MGQVIVRRPGTMRAQKQVFATAPQGLIELLTAHLPTSLTILRRLQFAARSKPSPTGRVLFVADQNLTFDKAAPSFPSKFTVMYSDFSVSTETQMFLYSTLEDKPPMTYTAEDRAVYEEQFLAIVDELIRLRNEFDPEGTCPTAMLLGSVHADVCSILEKTGRVFPRPTGLYDKWLFRVEDLPRAESPLPQGMHWGHASYSDCEIVVSRTDIPRTAATLSKLQSSLIKLDDGTPIAWAFLGN
ncbi:hypothetical protein JDV02_004321 [Purpureocillium takamizusanense]|uniref:Uncharacterized protein n=1 Tax=Purpureocillium takamizusanense TaxID=2060973 RepID=A0A9Q8VAN9_9HYPO|nr:uncharacterized protein JDV02_004321 [Purpureocillium takamizusanense]UNI18021.1 hypothetical protein JDV02_004321 [Purpureocillium takamizusanense]